MPPKRKRPTKDSAIDSKPAPKKPRAILKASLQANKRSMPTPIPAGAVFTDLLKKQWVLGKSVGKGGFGEIYQATLKGRGTTKGSTYVIKVEPHENGPLFSELAFYQRAAKQEMITSWIQDHRLQYLPVPMYVASGLHEESTMKYRFLVMDRFGEDVEKLFRENEGSFGVKTVCYLGLQMLEALEYLHSYEYVHADIKGSNILTGYGPQNAHKVYLVDYGLAYRYNPGGDHKGYDEDPRRRHDGTIEFTSIDAHNGAYCSRRSDLEILGYCLLQWASGQLPWEKCLTDKQKVANQKSMYKSNTKKLMTDCFSGPATPACLEEYMVYVYSLEYTKKPDYPKMKQLFEVELKKRGMKADSKGLDWLSRSKRKDEDIEDTDSVVSGKKKKELPAVPSQRSSIKARGKKGKATESKEKEEEAEIVEQVPRRQLKTSKISKKSDKELQQELSDSESEKDKDSDESDEEFLPSDSEEEEYRPSSGVKGRSSVSTRKSSRNVAKRSRTNYTRKNSESSKDSPKKLGKRVASERSVDSVLLQQTKTPRIAISPVRLDTNTDDASDTSAVQVMVQPPLKKVLLAKKMSLSPLKIVGSGGKKTSRDLQQSATSKQAKKPIRRAKQGAEAKNSVQNKIPVATYPAELGYQ